MSVLPGVFDYEVGIRSAFPGTFNQAQMTVAASQTIHVNDLLILSSGTVTQAIALPGSNNSVTLSGGSTALFGIALDSITTNASSQDNTGPFLKTTIPVAIFDPNLEVLFRIYNATAANTTYGSIVQGTAYQYGRWRGPNSSTWWYVLGTTTTNGELRFVDPMGLSNVDGVNGTNLSTDQYGLVWTRAVQSLVAQN